MRSLTGALCPSFSRQADSRRGSAQCSTFLFGLVLRCWQWGRMLLRPRRIIAKFITYKENIAPFVAATVPAHLDGHYALPLWVVTAALTTMPAQRVTAMRQRPGLRRLAEWLVTLLAEMIHQVGMFRNKGETILANMWTGLCCPTNYICRENGLCDPPAGVTLTCSSNAYLCASSLSGGCCPSGMGCNLNGCYTTIPSTYTITSGITTTNSAGSTITSVLTYTTVKTPSATVSKTSANAVAGYIQSTVSKIAAIETSTSSGGLNQAQLGGVIAGVIAVLIAIAVAAFLIIRELRKKAKPFEESKGGTSAANETLVSYKPGDAAIVTTTVTEVDAHDIDPLMLEPRVNRPAHLRAQSDSSLDDGHPSPARSPGLSSGQTTPSAWPGHYNPVPTRDSGERHASVESVPEGYYDAARQSQVSRSSVNRTSYDSQASNPRSRHWSYVSEVSGSADGAHGVSELETSEAASRRRSSSGATRPAAAHTKRTSDLHQRGRSDSSAPMAPPLSTLNEINELHGYYGPSDKQTGQTAARLKTGNSPTMPDK